MKRNTLSIILQSFAILAVSLLVACIDMDDVMLKMPEGPIEFGASICETNEVRTRALDSVFIAHDPFNMDFYIQLCSGTDYTKVGTYVVPSGYEGRLDSKITDEALNWHDHISPHTFYAWNIPWNNDESTYKDNDKFYPSSDEDKTMKMINEGINIKFYNSSEADGYGEHTNNAIYENFIGAKSEEHSYKDHGKYVKLVFHHLVSKIRIGDFILIEPGGAIQKNLQADVTFVGMPTEATFYPHPQEGGRPRVEPKKLSEDDGVSYYIDHEATTEDVFYICPEADFSNIDFKVQLRDKAYANYDTYYGTFDDVIFTRKPGTDYDLDFDENENPKDDKILHAGEMMTINITLIPGIGPGLSIIIDKWNTESPKESEYHANSGIYSDAEVKEILDVFLNQKDYNYDSIQEQLERLFEMYGWTDDDGNKYFPLYDNVTVNSNIFPIWKDYIIDGMGHTITMKTNPSNTGYVTGPYFNIGPVRDVYLTDGTNTIYIDKQGYVWIADPDIPGGYKQTENKLEPLTGDEKSYDISCKDGKVHKSTYYNNSITGS